MSEADLAIEGWGWARLVLGLAVFLLPGFALADRIFPAAQHLVFAPVLSFSALVLAATVLNFMAGIPVAPAPTLVLALAISVAAGWPRIQQAGRWARRRAR